MNGCDNCRHCKCYPGDYWTPDEYECTTDMELSDEVIDKVWGDCEEWQPNETPLCPGWEKKEEDYF